MKIKEFLNKPVTNSILLKVEIIAWLTIVIYSMICLWQTDLKDEEHYEYINYLENTVTWQRTMLQMYYNISLH